MDEYNGDANATAETGSRMRFDRHRWYLAKAVFGSAAALQSSFYHCDLWMIKRKRNQSLFSPSTIIDTMLNFDVNIDEHNTKRFTGMDMVYLVLLSTDITDIGNAHQLYFCIIMIIKCLNRLHGQKVDDVHYRYL